MIHVTMSRVLSALNLPSDCVVLYATRNNGLWTVHYYVKGE